MRLRIAVSLSALVVVMICAAGAPLALAVSANEARTVQLDRLADAARLASLVSPASDPVGAQALEDELRRYDDVYGNPVAVADTRGRVAVASRAATAFGSPAVRGAIRDGLAGRYPGQPARLVPWRDPDVVVWLPVVQDGEVVGAVVSISRAEAALDRVQRTWGLLGAGAVLALCLGIGTAWWLASWISRPLTTLDDAARALRPGRFSTRVPAVGGPPETRRLAASFNRMAESVQASFEAQDRFVADAGHQLRNPLGALLIRLDGLALDLGSDDATRGHAATAEAAARDARHLAETLETMLELARAKHNDSAAVEMDVARVLDERLLAWSVVATRRGLAIERSGPRRAPARHDPAAVAGALDVVLDNALKYSPEGASVQVEVLPVTPDGAVAVQVVNPSLADLGETEPGETEPGETDPGDAATGGAGIGLAIASTLLHLHGGRLEVLAEQDGVTRVTVLVPALPPQSGRLASPASAQGRLRV